MTARGLDDKFFLRLNVPFDISRVDDARFISEIESVPNGIKTSLLRYLLIRAMPTDPEEIEKLMSDVLKDHKARGTRRGRKKGSEQASALAMAGKAPKAMSEVSTLTVARSDVPGVEKKVAVEEVMDESNAVNPSDYKGILGGTTWNTNA